MKLHKYILVSAMAMTLGLTSCSDDDAVKAPLATVQGKLAAKSYDTLSFSWQPVEGARQYGLQLFNAAGTAIVTELTEETTAEFTELQPDTDYSLKIWAYAYKMDENATSEPLVLQARTNPLTPIATPVIQNITSSYAYQFEWTYDDNADEYEYKVLSADGETVREGSVETGSLSFTDLEYGDYVLEVKGISTEPGYTDGATGSIEFTVSLREVYRVQGTYTSGALGKTWDATLVAMSDRTYKLLGWYGVEGYDLDFEIVNSDTSNKFHILNEITPDSKGWYKIPTGLTSPTYIQVNGINNNCVFKGTQASGSITLLVYKSGNKTDKFVW